MNAINIYLKENPDVINHKLFLKTKLDRIIRRYLGFDIFTGEEFYKPQTEIPC